MNTCKCGKTKVSLTAGLPGTSIEIGCPICKTNAKAAL